MFRYAHTRGDSRSRGALQRALVGLLAAVLLSVSLAQAVPARARHMTSAFQVIFSTSHFGIQFLHAAADSPLQPDRATFTLANGSELWYGLDVNASSSSLMPTPVDPSSDLISALSAESELLPPSGIIPLNSNLTFFEQIKLAVPFSAPAQSVNVTLNPFDAGAVSLDIVRLLLALAGQQNTATEAGLLLPGAVRQILKQIKNAKDLAQLVSDFTSLLEARARGSSLLGPANACVSDLLHLFANSSELGALTTIFALALGPVIARSAALSAVTSVGAALVKVFLGLGDAAKFIVDLALSFGSYLFQEGDYPTVTLRSVESGTPEPSVTPTATPAPAVPGTITEYPVQPGSNIGFITTGPDGALWFTDTSGRIGRMTLDGTVTEYPLPNPNVYPTSITSGPDGNLWFAAGGGADPGLPPGQIGRMTLVGKVTLFTLPRADSWPEAVIAGPDGNLWYTDGNEPIIGRITPTGQVTEFNVLEGGFPGYGGGDVLGAENIAVGADGNVWFFVLGGNAGSNVGRITPAGKVTLFPMPDTSGGFYPSIVASSDGNLWFVDSTNDSIGRVTLEGNITEFPLPNANVMPWGMAAGSDGNVWFTGGTASDSEPNIIGRITPRGSITEFPIPLPTPQYYDLNDIAAGPDGTLLFPYGDKIGRITP